jgi:hypothetical protein
MEKKISVMRMISEAAKKFSFNPKTAALPA